jgi:ornithine carbamoyltransferase
MESKQVGDVVYMDSYTSMGQNSLGGYNKSTIEKIEYRFDEKMVLDSQFIK